MGNRLSAFDKNGELHKPDARNYSEIRRDFDDSGNLLEKFEKYYKNCKIKEMKNYVWQDIKGNKYLLKEIDDRYLFNILRFILKGGGNVDFLDVDKIKKLYNEANKRKYIRIRSDEL